MDYLMRQVPDTASLRSGKKIILLYLLDYIVIVVLFLVISALNFITPFNQHFALQNYTLQYPYAVHERVPVPVLYVCAIIAPAVIIAVWTLAIDPLLEGRRAKRAGRQRDPYKKGLWELNCGILGLLLANTVAYVITGVLKNAIGKPRPDLIDRCQPKVPEDHFVSPVFGLSDSSICTQTDQSILHDGFRSFPSGHSSSSFAGLFYLTLYLAGKLHFLDHQGSVWKVFVVLVPTLGAALIAGSRIMDARHHPFDVITGSLLGIVCAYVAYRQYFPAVTSFDRMGRAYTVRKYHGPTGTEPLRSVHRANPSFTFDAADTSLDPSLEHVDGHGKPYPSAVHGGGNLANIQRSRSQALAAEPLRQHPQQRVVSIQSNPRMSPGPEIGLAGAGSGVGVGMAGLARTYSPDPSFVSQMSVGGNANSLYGRASAEGPLGGDHHRVSAAWQQHHQRQLSQQYSPYRPDDADTLPISEFPGSPPIDGQTSPVELNPLPSPRYGSQMHKQMQQRTVDEEEAAAAEEEEEESRLDKSSMKSPQRHSRTISQQKEEEADEDSGGPSRYSFEEGGEHLIHPAFRNH